MLRDALLHMGAPVSAHPVCNGTDLADNHGSLVAHDGLIGYSSTLLLQAEERRKQSKSSYLLDLDFFTKLFMVCVCCVRPGAQCQQKNTQSAPDPP